MGRWGSRSSQTFRVTLAVVPKYGRYGLPACLVQRRVAVIIRMTVVVAVFDPRGGALASGNSRASSS